MSAKKDTLSGPSGDKKREWYLSWEQYFMGVALVSAQRSKDPVTQVGACIVNKDQRIVGVGYNGMPNGCKDEKMDWGKGESLDNKKYYVCHAELNAIVNKLEADIRDCTMYVTRFPCNECAKLIVQSRLKEVIYYGARDHERLDEKAAIKMFDEAGVKYSQYEKKATEFKIGDLEPWLL